MRIAALLAVFLLAGLFPAPAQEQQAEASEEKKSKPAIMLMDAHTNVRARRPDPVPLPPKPKAEEEPETEPDQEAAGDEDPIQVEVNVVNVPVTVTDPDGRFLVDLSKKDFEVFEDGKEVSIRYFTKITETSEEAGRTADRPPLHVGFLIDLSNTARLYYKYYQDSIGDLVYLLVPEGGKDTGFLMGYHTQVDLLVEPAKDPYPIARRMENLKHGGGSAMLDAIYEACTKVLPSVKIDGRGEPRKVLVIVGDGHDNASKRSLEQVISAAQREQVTIHAVSTVGWGYHEEEEKNIFRLAEATGGRVTHPMEDVHSDVAGFLSNPQDAGNYARDVATGAYARAKYQHIYNALIAVAGEVRNQYILGYTPVTPFEEGGFRDIKVKVNIPAKVEVRHRTGYYPPES